MSSRRGHHVLPSRLAKGTHALLPSLASLDVDTGMVVPLSFAARFLHVACSSNDVATTRRLLQRGADVEERNEVGDTPLHHVSWKGNVECARLLLEYGADVNACKSSDVTPLHLACIHAHLRCARLLLEYGADVNADKGAGVTPLHEACYHGHADCVALLLASGAEVAMMTNTRLETPLDLAARSFRSWHHDTAECQRLVRRATRERYGKQLVGGHRHPLLDWEETTPLDFDLRRNEGRAAVLSVLRALLLAGERRAGCELGEDATMSVVQAVAL